MSSESQSYIWGVVANRQQGKCNSKGCNIFFMQASATVLRLREGRGRPTLFTEEPYIDIQTKKLLTLTPDKDTENYEILCRACHENIKPHRVNFKVHPDIFDSWTKWKSTNKPDATLTSVILLAMDKLVNRDDWEIHETWNQQILEAKAEQYDRIVQITEQNIEEIAYEEGTGAAGTNIDADLE